MKKNNLILIGLLILTFWPIVLFSSKVALDYPYWYPESIKALFSYPLIWRDVVGTDGLGQFVGNSLFSWPVLFVYGLLGLINIPFPFIFILLGFLPFLFFGIWGMNKLLDFYQINGWGKFIGTFFFIANTYSILLIDGGQVFISIAYVLLPLSFVYFKESLKSYKRMNYSAAELTEYPRISSSVNHSGSRIKFIIVCLLISIFDIRSLFILSILIFLDFIFTLLFLEKTTLKKFIKSYALIGFLIMILLIGFHAYWLLPSFLSKTSFVPPTYERLSQVEFLSFTKLSNSFFLLQPHWFKNVFGQILTFNPEFILIPILVFLSPILKPRNKIVGFWMFVALFSIFLAKGSSDPLPDIYNYLFINIPGFSAFRDPTKFFFLIAISFSILIGITINVLARSKLFKFKIIFFLFLIYFIWLIRPVFLNQMTGIFSVQPLEKEYFDLAEKLKMDEEFGRILWIPTLPPLGYSSPTHPTIYAYLLAQKRPFAVSTTGTYDTLNFLKAPFMGELFNIAGIKYIIYPFPDTRREELKPDNIEHYYTFLEDLSNLPWTSLESNLTIPIINVKNSQNKFFVADNLWFVAGSDNLYKESTKSAGLKLSKNALVFLEEYPGLVNNINQFPEAKIVLNEKSDLDLAANYIDSKSLFFPASKLDFNPDKSGWWKKEASDLVEWRNFLQTKYELDSQDFDLGGGWAVAEGSLELTVQSERFEKEKVLLARVMESSKSGEISFFQNDRLIGQINTQTIDGTNFKWFEVGILTSSDKITIKTEGDINVVNALASLDKKSWEEHQEKVSELVSQKRLAKFEGSFISTSSAIIKYDQINPTKYKVTISNLEKPTFLVFSENYNSMWTLNSKNSLPVYSLINGFRIDKNGEYILEFKLQKYVNLGLIISGVTIVIVLIMGLWEYKKR